MADTGLIALDVETARRARDEVLAAIKSLLASLAILEGKIEAEAFEKMRRTVGLAIGKLEVDYLQTIFVRHPELDDLANPEGPDAAR